MDRRQAQDLYIALHGEYRARERDYRMAKRAKLDDAVIANLTVMHSIQRVLERAGLERFEGGDD
jgi:hypothetical protein